ncbi:MAG: type I-D CRISPR-associated protein Cas10d/Csc3 [Spirulina sp.]
MTTLLQSLLIETLAEENEDSVLHEFINTILPDLERNFAFIPALGGIEEKFANKADQSLLVHVLNGLCIAWNLSQELSDPLSEVEQRLLCLGFTLHDYDKYYHHRGQESPGAHDTSEIVRFCEKLADILHFERFWEDWKTYKLDVCFLAQNTQRKRGSDAIASNWENDIKNLVLDYSELDRLCDLLAFGDISVHMTNPADLIAQSSGDRLFDYLEWLGLDEDKKLIYHRLRDCRGLLTNQIHNAIVNFGEDRGWKPILYFAQGTIYLVPQDTDIPTLKEIQATVWETILQGNPDKNLRGLEEVFTNGDVGFIRSGKGLKIAPLTRELFSPAKLIQLLANVVKETVKNIKNPATPKRLQKIELSDRDRQFLERGADVWADRLAEFIILVQREFFSNSEEFSSWILNTLELQKEISLEQTKEQKGGVNYGWYRVAAHYIAKTELDRHPTSAALTQFLEEFSKKLANWAEEKQLLPTQNNSTYQSFCSYLQQYLEVAGWKQKIVSFESELLSYMENKSNNRPICSLSSGEFAAEDQLDSVVLFKPQQYSNKNPLGKRRVKRGISKIWSLEMILRQAYWKAPAGKFEDQKTVFLYIFPAYVYSPQTARAIGKLVKKLQKVNLWEVRKKWIEAKMNYRELQNLLAEELDPEAGKRFDTKYDSRVLPFMAIVPPKSGKKTNTEAWVEPAFLSLILPLILGVKVVATPSSDPIYRSDAEFLESIRLDETPNFWTGLGLKNELRLQELELALKHLLAIYCLHLETRSNAPDARWPAFNGTVREVMTDVLNVFVLANEGLRQKKRDPSDEEVLRYWKFAKLFAEGESQMSDKLELTQRLVEEYRTFYRVRPNQSSSHAILLPLSKALEEILSVPDDWTEETMILQGSGLLKDALDRQEAYNRPFLLDKSLPYETRLAKELEAIRTFMTTCVKELFGGMCKGDRALLQENRNRIKSGAEFAYRWLALHDKSKSTADLEDIEF